MMRSLALRIVVLWGWRRLVTAGFAGAVLIFALPPFYFLPVIFISFPVLVWLLDGVASNAGRWRNAVSAGLIGWTFGFGYFLASLSWLSQAFLVEAELFAWMIPIAVTSLPAGLALFWGLACATARLFWSPGFARIFSLAASLTVFEWLRGQVLTGFPWNALGYMLAGSAEIMQVLSITGIFGIGFIAVFTAACPAVATGDAEAGRLMSWRGPVVAVIVLGCVWGYGAWRLNNGIVELDPAFRLRLVQANIPQADKWRPENRSQIFARYLELSNQATSPASTGVEDFQLVIWPESALPFLLEENDNARAQIAALLPATTRLITGALRRDAAPGKRRPIYNSILVVGGGGKTLGRYDKSHLVPFGEYLPFERWLSRWGFRKLVTVPAGFKPGSGKKHLKLAGFMAAVPLVCYEAIFPSYSSRAGGAGWILNVTNDAWFGRSIGPWQHFEQARARAIEQGLPLIRAANTGISAVIDPYGRAISRLGLGKAGVIDARMPKPIAPTIYARYRELPVLFMVLLSLCFGFIFGARARGATR
jgi:apolipoprotein N-acyltransferase